MSCVSAEEDEVVSEEAEAFVELQRTMQCIISSVVEYPQVVFYFEKQKNKQTKTKGKKKKEATLQVTLSIFRC